MNKTIADDMILALIEMIRMKIRDSHGCEYLYAYFNELVAGLDNVNQDELAHSC